MPTSALKAAKARLAPSRSQLVFLLPTLVSGGVASALYLSTLMLTVSGCDHVYCADIGEFQVALPEWGTVHQTGYPLYMLLGSPFVTLLRWAGVAPTVSASLFSFGWAILAIMAFTLIVRRITGRPWVGAGAGLTLAVLQPFWFHGVVAEVYSLSGALSCVILWLTLDLRESWSDRRGWWLAFFGGLGLAHHRLIAFLLIPVGLYLLAPAWRSKNFWRWLALSVPCFLAGFLPYLDIPLRAWRGATWIYSQPTTWQGFWWVFLGLEVKNLQQPDLSLPALLTTARTLFGLLRGEIGGSGLAAAALGGLAALSARRLRAPTLLFMGISGTYLLFAIVFSQAVMLEAVIIMPLLCLVACLALGLSRLPGRWSALAALGLLGWSAFLAVRHYPFIVNLTRDQTSVQYAAQMEKLEAPRGAVVMALWGREYFALSYAQRVEGRLVQWHIVDHRADFPRLAGASDGRIYMSADSLYIFTEDEWRQRLGAPLRITSAGPGLLAISCQPLASPTGPTYPIGDQLALVNWAVRPPDAQGRTDIVLYWVARQTPSINYSTFVHVTDKDDIVSADDLLAQSDAAAPVYGWYPTTQWQPNEMVREDHLVSLPPDRSARTILAGMYARSADGSLTPLGKVALTNVSGQWQVRP